MPRNRRPPGGRPTQSWTTFLHCHGGAVLACDFFVVVTATFQRVYVFVILDIATRRILHWNVTAHPTAEWTVQQFRNGLPLNATYRFVVHVRDVPLNERHLCHVLGEWMAHYNAEPPHSARGPGLPDDTAANAVVTGQRILPGWRVIAHPRLGGLHHHYALKRAA